MPDSIKFAITPPPIAAPSTAAVVTTIKDATRARESEFRIKYKIEGRKFLGARAVKAQKITRAPKSSGFWRC